MEDFDGRKGGFRDLQNYTTLKQRRRERCVWLGFRDLQNYTTLKLHGTLHR